MFNFLLWITLNFNGKTKITKERNGDICRGTLDIEFEQDWSVGLGTALGDGKKNQKYFFSSFSDFSGKIR